MFLNFLLWIIAGLGIGYLGHYFDINKKKGMDIYLFIGVMLGFSYAFIFHFVFWSDSFWGINIFAILVASVANYFSLRVIDYFFHL